MLDHNLINLRRNLAGLAMDCLAYEAARDGKIDFLKRGEAIRLNPGLLSEANMKGDTPLHTASRTGCLGMVELFISLCDDVERTGENAPWNLLRMVNQEGDTALHVAVRNGHLDVVKLLVDADIEWLLMHNKAKLLDMHNKAKLLDMHNKANESPLYLAVERGFFAIANHILNKCPTCSHRGTKGMTALHAAVVRTHQGHERGNDVPHLISLESLRRFVYNIVFKVLEYLGGSVSSQTDDIMPILLDKKKDMVKETDIFGWTPLHYAAQLGYLQATRKLLECEKSVAYLLDKEDSSALHIAAKKGYINIMEEITKQCPCVYNLVDKNGWTILHVAAQCGESKVVKYILEVRGWESLRNEIDNEGNTALHLAAIYGHYDSVSILARDGRVDKRATNKKYLKAIDIVQTNMDLGEIKKYWIMRKLENSGAQQSLERLIIRENTDRTINDNEGPNEGINELELREDRERTSLHASESLRHRNNEVVKKKEITSKYLKDVSNTHLLVATLIATVTFAACFSLPGGYNQDDPNKGKSVLSTKVAFKAFVITDGIAFYCSTAAVFLPLFCFTGTKLPFAPTFHKIWPRYSLTSLSWEWR
ncbi:Protein accellerated cell death 6 [Vitis vinifera]|uniref:Protein accellerated cell death 6 n=1 Tax=Vitis vinifera TaxID=29760 RepID=A0A438D0Q4_VITVI|nr:Protein accellerated cell death 6 [Vitis vinifera]